jgi:hypothetical protein
LFLGHARARCGGDHREQLAERLVRPRIVEPRARFDTNTLEHLLTRDLHDAKLQHMPLFAHLAWLRWHAVVDEQATDHDVTQVSRLGTRDGMVDVGLPRQMPAGLIVDSACIRSIHSRPLPQVLEVAIGRAGRCIAFERKRQQQHARTGAALDGVDAVDARIDLDGLEVVGRTFALERAGLREQQEVANTHRGPRSPLLEQAELCTGFDEELAAVAAVLFVHGDG